MTPSDGFSLRNVTVSRYPLRWMAARALVFMVPVVYRERQSDNHKDDHDDLVCRHDYHPLCRKRVKAKRHRFPSCRGRCPGSIISCAGFCRQSKTARPFRARGVDFRGLLCYNDGRKGLRNRCLHRPDLCQSLKRRVLRVHGASLTSSC